MILPGSFVLPHPISIICSTKRLEIVIPSDMDSLETPLRSFFIATRPGLIICTVTSGSLHDWQQVQAGARLFPSRPRPWTFFVIENASQTCKAGAHVKDSWQLQPMDTNLGLGVKRLQGREMIFTTLSGHGMGWK